MLNKILRILKKREDEKKEARVRQMKEDLCKTMGHDYDFPTNLKNCNRCDFDPFDDIELRPTNTGRIDDPCDIDG